MRYTKRTAAWAMIAALLLFLYFSAGYMAHEYTHDCDHDHCETCMHICQIRALRQGFCPGDVILAEMFFPLIILLVVCSGKEDHCYPHTLVSLKIRLND